MVHIASRLTLIECVQVPLTEGALLNAPLGSVGAFVRFICKALQGHELPDANSQPREQVGLLLSHIL